MTDFNALLVADRGQDARTITIIEKAGFADWLAAQPDRTRMIVSSNRFEAKPAEMLILPGETVDGWTVIAGAARHPGVWDLAGVAARLPAGTYRLSSGNPGIAALGWLLAHDRFDRYLTKPDPVPQRTLLSHAAADIPELVHLAQATAFVRELVNTPAADLGPADLEHQAERLATEFGSKLTVTRGTALETGYPMVHAVGKAADKSRAPRMIEIEWGNPANPRIAIIGKGVVFDSGGLDIKPAGGMRLMKKDMGGAAHALALARLIMAQRLPISLHLLVPAVENAISGIAFRPGDVLTSRKGISVEIENTDAEGRLILADAITKAAESSPELIIDFATLTGAARVALGPDLPAMFCNDHDLARTLSESSVAVHDAVWRLPLWSRYEDLLKSDIADIANSSESGMAGAITAALFLKKFVPSDTKWVHLDTFAWRSASSAGQPKGGEALGLRAIWEMLSRVYARA